jgi:hypothetical protein
VDPLRSLNDLEIDLPPGPQLPQAADQAPCLCLSRPDTLQGREVVPQTREQAFGSPDDHGEQQP